MLNHSPLLSISMMAAVRGSQQPVRTQTQTVKRNSTGIDMKAVQRIWTSLHLNLDEIVEQDDEEDLFLHQMVPEVTVLDYRRKNMNMDLDPLALREFESKLQINIDRYIKSHADMGINVSSCVGQYASPEDLLFELHLGGFLKLIGTLVVDLDDGKAIVEARHISSKIWRFDPSHYNLIGEGLVSTILEVLGRQNFSLDDEYAWIKFYNKVTNLLLSKNKGRVSGLKDEYK